CFLVEALTQIMLREKFSHLAPLRFGIKGTSGNVVEADVFFIELPSDCVTIIEPIEPSFFPGHEPVRWVLGGKVCVFWRQELKFMERDCVSNCPRRECDRTHCAADDGQLDPIQDFAVAKHQPCSADPAADQEQRRFRSKQRYEVDCESGGA